MVTTLGIVKKFYPNVTSVVDSKRNVTIEVTKKDTNSSAVKNHKECALAVACKRKGADGAIICVKVAYLIQGDKAVRYMLPESVSREITSFDRNAGFEPGVYHLAKVCPANRMDRPREDRVDKRKNHGGQPAHRTDNIRKIEKS